MSPSKAVHLVGRQQGLLNGYILSDQNMNNRKQPKPQKAQRQQKTAESSRLQHSWNPNQDLKVESAPTQSAQTMSSPKRTIVILPSSHEHSDINTHSNHHFPNSFFTSNMTPPYNAHRTKGPIKSALKKSKIMCLPGLDIAARSSMTQSPQHSPNLSTPTRATSSTFSLTANTETMSDAATTKAPPVTSSSFTRRQYNKQRLYDAYNNGYALEGHDDSWRKDGKEIRKKLIEADDATCSNELVINKQRNLAKYCGIADRVQDQFQVLYDTGDRLEEAYIMGNRLIKFLSEVLPTHDHYYSKQSELTKLRIKTQNNLLKVREQMEDISYAFDKEIFKIEMEKQGLEFDQSPGRILKGRKTRRKKIVTFAVEDDEHHDCEFRYAQQQQPQQQTHNSTEKNHISISPTSFLYTKPPSEKRSPQRTDKLSVPVSSFSDCDLDLSLWEDCDPEIQIIDMSVSSGDNSFDIDDQLSGQDSLFSLEDADSSLQCRRNDDKPKNKEQPTPTSFSHNFEVDLFNPADEDGWESVKETPETNFEWPGMEAFSREEESNVLSNNDVQITIDLASEENELEDYIEEESEEIDEEVSEQSTDSVYEDDAWDMSLEEDISFVEKIALENINSSINEFRDNDEDSDAADSWEQNSAGDDVLDSKKSPPCIVEQNHLSTAPMPTHGTAHNSKATDETKDYLSNSPHKEHLEDVLDSKKSLPCIVEQNHLIAASMPTHGTAHTSKATDETKDNLINSPQKEHLEDVLDSEKSLPCTVEQNHLIAVPISTHETANTSKATGKTKDNLIHSPHKEHLDDELQQEFMPNFDMGDEESEENYGNNDSEVDDTANFNGIGYPGELTRCDSIGADKTVLTSDTGDTEAMTTDDNSEGSRSSHSRSDHDGAVIGISRRDDYYSSFDNPRRHEDGNGLSKRIENVQDKIKDLQIVKASKIESEFELLENVQQTTVAEDTEKASYPIQMGRGREGVSAHEILEESTEDLGKSKTEQKPQPSTPTSSACRLKNMRGTERWRRRYRQ